MSIGRGRQQAAVQCSRQRCGLACTTRGEQTDRWAGRGSTLCALLPAAVSLNRMMPARMVLGIAVGFFVGHVGKHKTNCQHKQQGCNADGCLEVLMIFHGN